MKKSQLRQIIKECIQEVLEGEKFSLYEIPFVSGMSVEGVTPGEASIITTPEDLKYHQEKIEKAFGVDVVFEKQGENRYKIIDHPSAKAMVKNMDKYYNNSTNNYTGD
tara:strand:- start:51 stop:374 length:324 start_codon:yes stop_codon:yes gene_type:complete